MSGRHAALWLVLFTMLTGCGALGSDHAVGWADVRFDDVPLGAADGPFPRIDCRRRKDRTIPSQITDPGRSLGNGPSNWRPGGQGPRTSLSLRFPARFLSGWEVRVRFSIGSSVYQRDYEHGSDVRIAHRWKNGRAVLRDIPLVSGDPYEGKASLTRLVVEWHCQEPGSTLVVPPPGK